MLPLNGARDTPRRFAEAKAKKLPWTNASTTRFILEGTPVEDERDEPGVPAREGLGEPAQHEEVRTAEPTAEEPPPLDGEHAAAQAREGVPAPTNPLALPTETLSEFRDAEE
eukprot:2444555-Amphidinium_carterae.1